MGGRPLLAVVLAALTALAVAGCGEARPDATLEIAGRAMGTAWTVRAVGVSSGEGPRLAREIEAVLAEVDARFSTWRDDSEIARFNAHRGAEPFTVSAPTAAVLAKARTVGAASGGALDVTVGPLVDLWGFGAAPAAGWPDEAALARARASVGWRHLEIRTDPPVLLKHHPAVRVDCSAIAKGHAVQRVADRLVRLGVPDVLVELGGEVAARGRARGGVPWTVGIERPDASGRLHRSLPLVEAALATSGDYRRHVVRDGRRLTHVLDPRSGRPVAHTLASVTVLHPDGALADAWATALLVLGPETAMATARREGLAVLLLVRDGDGFVERVSPGFPGGPAVLDEAGGPKAARQADGGTASVLLTFGLGFALFVLAAGALACRRRLRACAGACPPPPSTPPEPRHGPATPPRHRP